ncbi:hypothetical protein Mgra_00006445 [Meloidogyne graminicola]|uniref:Uncharacterized protein n=1 Tax=Meloidogyne graminicola TaxID=189291 RepID=A0A8S9ZL09_9BILA|nr:hypothetical protein Mgra_00006445 [Meloidogyne graminicola]
MNFKILIIYLLFASVLFELIECGNEKDGKEKGRKKKETKGQGSSGEANQQQLVYVDPQEVNRLVTSLQESQRNYQNLNVYSELRKKEQEKIFENHNKISRLESKEFTKKLKNMLTENNRETKELIEENVKAFKEHLAQTFCQPSTNRHFAIQQIDILPTFTNRHFANHPQIDILPMRLMKKEKGIAIEEPRGSSRPERAQTKGKGKAIATEGLPVEEMVRRGLVNPHELGYQFLTQRPLSVAPLQYGQQNLGTPSVIVHSYSQQIPSGPTHPIQQAWSNLQQQSRMQTNPETGSQSSRQFRPILHRLTTQMSQQPQMETTSPFGGMPQQGLIDFEAQTNQGQRGRGGRGTRRRRIYSKRKRIETKKLMSSVKKNKS